MKRRRQRKEGLATLGRIQNTDKKVILIHYSCESFYDRPKGTSPRITSIACRLLSTGQTKSFSIHMRAEMDGVPMDSITQDYDKLEKAFLRDFQRYVKDHKDALWVHWNMRDVNYGFEAISHRMDVLKILGGLAIPEENRIDLARLMVSLYGVGYIGHPRLKQITEKNKISDLGFLIGKEEAAAFDAGEYWRLHQSTLRKVDVFANLLERVVNGTLKVNSSWREIQGISWEDLVDAAFESTARKLVTLVALFVTVSGWVAFLWIKLDGAK